MKASIPFALIAALAVACEHEAAGTASSAPQETTQRSIPDDLLIKLERTWCLGPCPIYEVTIDANGHVRWFGHEHVDVTGQQNAEVSVADVRKLVDRMDAIDFTHLHDSYDVFATDIDGALITLRRAGESKCVRVRGADLVAEAHGAVYVSDDEDPDDKLVELDFSADHRQQYASTFAALDELAADIDKVAGTARWIGTAPKQRHR